MSSSLIRCLLFLVVCEGLIQAKLLDSELLQETAAHRLTKLRNDLIEAKKKSASETKQNEQQPLLPEVLEGLNKEAETAEKAKEDVNVKTIESSDKEPIQELQQKEKEVQQEKPAESPVGGHETQEEQPVEQDTKVAQHQVENVNGGEDVTEDDDDGDDDHHDDDDDDDKKASGGVGDGGDELDGADVMDAIFYVSAGLLDEAKTMCNIDIAAIFKGFSPATASQTNDAQAKLLSATKELNDLLPEEPAFANDLKAFLDSKEYDDSKVAENIDKAFNAMNKTLSAVRKKLFCSEVQIIAARLQMALYGGIGFANGYLCNKVFVELARLQLNATKVMNAVGEDKSFVKNCTKSLIEDISCYERELKAFNKVMPTTQYTDKSPLQMAAFTSDFLINYGVILMYHRLILELEAEVVKLCAAGEDESDENEVDRNADETVNEEASLTEQLQKLLKKLNEVSAKKKAAEASLLSGKDVQERSEAKIPSVGQKIALKKSYYREREG